MDAIADRHEPGHHVSIPEWGRLLWDRVWRMQAHLDRLESRMTEFATQADVDAETAVLTAADQRIEAEIATLQAAAPQLDFSGLIAAIGATDAVVPAPVAPTDPTPTV